MSNDDARRGKYLGHEIADRQATQLIGIAQGLIADNKLSDDEINFLHKWLVANEAVKGNSLLLTLVKRVEEIVSDGEIDPDEREDLQKTLVALTANDFELGEVIKSSTLPLCNPSPIIEFKYRNFCLTGTFTFGRRRDCEAEIFNRGGNSGPLNKKTDFLVVGEYSTESWKQETFGRKIEKAVTMRDKGYPIAIVSEAHWRNALSE